MFRRLFSRKPDYEIVPVLTADAVIAAEIHAAAFGGPRTARAWSDGEFLSLISQPSVFGFLACAAGTARDAASGFVLAREAAGEAEILTIGVKRGNQRSGLGWRLMQAATREAVRRGAEELFLEVDEANVAAVALYARLGFVKVGERRAYYAHAGSETSTALVLRRDLR
ncbi:ribosomal-protein-alanine N-acetyltransferase [Hoeflea marina]|uniref:Ribosomal-protein-alanine N-acetyltransferase n=1 Tax=Hoeflea marina TaxID=274592 RepID=A0A317PIL5_9HYPH|nr:GNAT family N-acetyltransferase [Hoeflea marina]PWW00174.1 ribosomal-protein-alanine N-acetyltransferase [Hoeflea marina]